MKQNNLKRNLSWLLFAALLVAFSGCAQMNKSAQTEQTLYQRLGGYDAVAAVVDDFMGRMGSDAKLKRHFEDMDKESSMRMRQLIVDMVCNATGGPCYYTGRDMKTVHEGMGIDEADWQLSVKYLTATLDKFSVPEQEQKELFAIVGSLQGDIVEK